MWRPVNWLFLSHLLRQCIVLILDDRMPSESESTTPSRNVERQSPSNMAPYARRRETSTSQLRKHNVFRHCVISLYYSSAYDFCTWYIVIKWNTVKAVTCLRSILKHEVWDGSYRNFADSWLTKKKINAKIWHYRISNSVSQHFAQARSLKLIEYWILP